MSYSEFLKSRNFNPGYNAVRMVVNYIIERFRENSSLQFLPYLDELSKKDAYFSLLITTKYDWETKFRGKRPAIFVSRGNLLSALSGVGAVRVLAVTDSGETTSYLDLVSFPLMIECIAESDIESEALSSMVAAYLAMDARPLRSLGLQMQSGITQTPPQLYEKGNTAFISSVIIQVQAERQITARVIGNVLLDKIKLAITQNTSSSNIEITKDSL